MIIKAKVEVEFNLPSHHFEQDGYILTRQGWGVIDPKTEEVILLPKNCLEYREAEAMLRAYIEEQIPMSITKISHQIVKY